MTSPILFTPTYLNSTWRGIMMLLKLANFMMMITYYCLYHGYYFVWTQRLWQRNIFFQGKRKNYVNLKKIIVILIKTRSDSLTVMTKGIKILKHGYSIEPLIVGSRGCLNICIFHSLQKLNMHSMFVNYILIYLKNWLWNIMNNINILITPSISWVKIKKNK